MSITSVSVAQCRKCGQQHKIQIYKSINISENAELKNQVKNGSLFLWECPHCGQVNLAKYETLYHDPMGKLMVWLIPHGEISEAQMEAITRHTKAMGGYTLRRVEDMGSLIEKVLIHEAGLDDAVIEMCKYITKMEMIGQSIPEEKKEEFFKSSWHFHKIEGDDEDKLITFSYAFDGQMQGVNIGYNIYQNCAAILERNPQIKPADGFARINADWLSSIIA